MMPRICIGSSSSQNPSAYSATVIRMPVARSQSAPTERVPPSHIERQQQSTIQEQKLQLQQPVSPQYIRARAPLRQAQPMQPKVRAPCCTTGHNPGDAITRWNSRCAAHIPIPSGTRASALRQKLSRCGDAPRAAREASQTTPPASNSAPTTPAKLPTIRS